MSLCGGAIRSAILTMVLRTSDSFPCTRTQTSDSLPCTRTQPEGLEGDEDEEGRSTVWNSLSSWSRSWLVSERSSSAVCDPACHSCTASGMHSDRMYFCV